jgi:hypothetical protein
MNLNKGQIYKFGYNADGDEQIYTGKYLGSRRGFHIFQVKSQIIPVRESYLRIIND